MTVDKLLGGPLDQSRPVRITVHDAEGGTLEFDFRTVVEVWDQCFIMDGCQALTFLLCSNGEIYATETAAEIAQLVREAVRHG